MADDYQDRTEQPTPKRRQEARRKGMVARSRDLSSALVLLSGLLILGLWSGVMGRKTMEMLKVWLTNLRPGLVTQNHLPVLLANCGLAMAGLVAPVFLGLAVTAVLANYLQVGWLFAPERLTPDLSRVQLFAGLKRLFSLHSLVLLASSLLKVILIGVVVYVTLKGEWLQLLPLLNQEVGQIVGYLEAAGWRISGRIILAFLALGVLDFFYQRHRHEKSLKMTKQEVREEMRQMEGDPKVKARIRSIMRQLATKRMMAKVPTADVVVTNPTRLAVALKYDGSRMLAPEVVAKGQGFIALKIIALAQEAGVPLVENRPLAQSLFKQVEVGQAIPTTLYRAVAEVLAYVYSLRAAAGGRS